MFTYFLGIDPGLTGAIAVLDENKIKTVYDFPKDNPRKLLDIYKSLNTPDTRAVIEDIIIMPGKRNKLYESFFWHKFCLEYYGIAYISVHNMTIKKEFGLTKSKGKDDAFCLALKIFDESSKDLKTKTKDHNRADALLIAEYCRRIN